MGKFLKTKLKSSVELGGIILAILIAFGATVWFMPGLGVKEAIVGSKMTLDVENINNLEQGAELQLPSENPSAKVKTQPLFRIGGYPWNGQTGMMAAAGGKQTKEGSLMELNNVNFGFVRKDGVTELQNLILNFAAEFDKGANEPQSDMSAQGIILMGDGAPFFVATTQKLLNEQFKGKYHVQIVGAFGMSYGEDKLVGPAEWKNNPQSMLGKVISVVYGDGCWVVVQNYCAANGLKVNPDHTTYDPNAVNLYPSENDDFIKSAEELIKSQKSGFTVELDEIIDGKRTGKKVTKKIDGMASWTPADKMVFDALDGFSVIVSTRDFNNQMPTTLIVLKEWADNNPNIVTKFLTSVYTASNQVKQFDSWARRGAKANAESFGMESEDYWYNLFKGQDKEKNGIKYFEGGSKVLNLTDAKQYYGLGVDGVSRYKSVYDGVSRYLTEFKPFGFKDEIPTYDQVVDLKYIQAIRIGNSSGVSETKDYSKGTNEVLAKGSWRFNFATASANILSTSDAELDKLYNILMQAEDTKIAISGHTDNTGNYDLNKTLSLQRAEAVRNWLINKGVNPKRIQSVTGSGSDQPIADNTTSEGKAKNRRTDVMLLK